MLTFNQIEILVCTIPVTLHLLGFSLLYTSKSKTKFMKIQRLYLLNLSFAVFWLCVLSIVKRIFTHKQALFYITCIQNGGFAMSFYLTMIVLTIDRGLLVRWNLRYNSRVTLTMSRYVIAGILLLSTLFTVVICFTHLDIKLMYYFFGVFFWGLADTVFLLTAIATYIYIAYYNRQRRRLVYSGPGLQYQKKVKKMIYLPTLLVTSYIFTFMIADATNFYYSVTKTTYSKEVGLFLSCFYYLSYSLDAILYIFFNRAVRENPMLKNLFATCKRKHLMNRRNSNATESRSTQH